MNTKTFANYIIELLDTSNGYIHLVPKNTGTGRCHTICNVPNRLNRLVNLEASLISRGAEPVIHADISLHTGEMYSIRIWHSRDQLLWGSLSRILSVDPSGKADVKSIQFYHHSDWADQASIYNDMLKRLRNRE